MEFKTFIPIPLYDYKIYVIFTDNLEETAKSLQNKGLLSKSFNAQDTGAFHIKFNNQSYSYLIFKPNADSNQIAHECYHAVSTMFKWISATHEEELFAYTLGYLVQEVVTIQLKAISKKSKILLDKSKNP